MLASDGIVKRSVLVVIFDVYVCSGRQEEVDRANLAPGRGAVESCSAIHVDVIDDRVLNPNAPLKLVDFSTSSSAAEPGTGFRV